MNSKVEEIHHLFPEEKVDNNKSQIIYHYTDYGALENILIKKHIRLTSFRQLNDFSDGRLLFEKVLEHLELSKREKIKIKLKILFKEIFEDAYCASFCGFGNKLSQWCAYGNVNIGFDYQQLNNDRHFIIDKENVKLYTSGLFFDKCKYLDPTDTQIIREKVDHLLNKFSDLEDANLENENILQYQALKLGLFLFSQKHISFFEESEYRVVHFRWKVLPFENNSNNKLFIKLPFNEKAVKRIVIGPSKEQEVIKNRIILFLENKSSDYSHVEVVKSKIPFLGVYNSNK